ncbi:MAG: hypothetical protein JXR51_13635 [Bacteroidales bacterium]|nr:hypothetical protein [Bacteroidales bacterium]MBN2758209.1 hypothetical protein [Bacteroidales bacterium]
MTDNCPKTEKCPLFQGEILASKKAQEIYMDLYCTKGETGRNRCKRFLLSLEINNPVPIDVMPNDTRNLDKLIEIYS